MFARASKRTLYRDLYKHKQSSSGLDFLNLPFLCPALFIQPNVTHKDSITLRPASSQSHPRPSSRSSSRDVPSTTPSNRRSLASAAAAIQYDPEPDDYVPWAESAPPTFNFDRQPNIDGAAISTLRHFDPSNPPIVFRDTFTTYPKTFRVKDAITGDLNELHQNLHACLQVGRLERAAALVRRLNQIYNPGAAGLLAAHSDYVREITNKIVQTQDQRLLKDLQKWFEVDLKRVGVSPNAEIYAQMIRAGSHLSGASRHRAMRRYQKMADEAGYGVETRALSEFDGFDSTSVCKYQRYSTTS